MYLDHVLFVLFVYRLMTPSNDRCFQPLNIFTLQRLPCSSEIQISVSRRKNLQACPKDPNAKIVAAFGEFKKCNFRFGCVQIAQQFSITFGIDLPDPRADEVELMVAGP
ncbi:MAG TPA: hypothetical protein DCR17_10530 [Verrucomicrobiales bacterium]|nr:hypothetical protein [Pedosphaera sp.]HAO67106.1 hypothetical protein [Verrucomicrobiales bacterium]HBP55292.1 hypothetical protein [Verrucomicrobiales bacterium]HCP38092.1 hypothetical protein [Verrucomicrobiales bacterium]